MVIAVEALVGRWVPAIGALGATVLASISVGCYGSSTTVKSQL